MKLRESYERCRTIGPLAMQTLKEGLERSKISHRVNGHTTEIVADANKDTVMHMMGDTDPSDLAFALFVKEQRAKTYIRLRYQ